MFSMNQTDVQHRSFWESDRMANALFVFKALFGVFCLQWMSLFYKKKNACRKTYIMHEPDATFINHNALGFIRKCILMHVNYLWVNFPELFFPAPVLIKSGGGGICFLSYWSHSWRHTKTSELQSAETALEFYWRRRHVCLKRREGQTWLCWRVFSTQITGFRMFFQAVGGVELFVPVHYRQPKGQTILLGWSSLDYLWLLAHAQPASYRKCVGGWPGDLPNDHPKEFLFFSSDLWGWCPILIEARLDIYRTTVFCLWCLKAANWKHSFDLFNSCCLFFPPDA